MRILRPRTILLLVTVAAAMCVVSYGRRAAERPTVRYTIRAIGEHSPDGSEAKALNERGDVLFRTVHSGSTSGPILISAPRSLFIDASGAVRPVALPAVNYYPEDLGEGGEVVGSRHLGLGYDGLLWRGNRLRALYVGKREEQPGGWTFYAGYRGLMPRAIAPDGTIVGATLDAMSTVPRRAFRWKDGHFTDLTTWPGVSGKSIAEDINRAGAIAGSCQTKPGAWRPVIWESGRSRPLGVLPGFEVNRARAINDRGQVVGISERGGVRNTIIRAWMWDGGRIKALPRSSGNSFVHDINNDGRSVGMCNRRGRPLFNVARWRTPWKMVLFDVEHLAALWDDGRLRDLNDLIPRGSGWTLESAEAINDRGQIAGNGTLHGTKRAFLLTPLP